MDEKSMDRVKITVKSIAGHCGGGHCVGDEAFVENMTLTAPICLDALYCLWPHIHALRCRGQLPWGDKDGTLVPCPDGKNQVVFEVRRAGPLRP